MTVAEMIRQSNAKDGKNWKRRMAIATFAVSLLADGLLCIAALVSVPWSFWRFGFWHGLIGSAASLFTFAVLRELFRAVFGFALAAIDPGTRGRRLASDWKTMAGIIGGTVLVLAFVATLPMLIIGIIPGLILATAGFSLAVLLSCLFIGWQAIRHGEDQ